VTVLVGRLSLSRPRLATASSNGSYRVFSIEPYEIPTIVLVDEPTITLAGVLSDRVRAIRKRIRSAASSLTSIMVLCLEVGKTSSYFRPR
jgi:hypothetical protein